MDHLHLTGFCPGLHAAVEEYLFREGDGGAFFLTYVNGPSVHLGRHQVPEYECSPAECRRHRIAVLRRISGGGAVYHDRGVLNYAFVVPRGGSTPEGCLALVAGCLRKGLGVAVGSCPRHGFWHRGRKVGGSASALNGRRLLVHGCLPVAVDLARLEETLTPEVTGSPYRFPALRSVRAPVGNLGDLVPGLSPEGLARALHAWMRRSWPGPHLWRSTEGMDLRRYEQREPGPGPGRPDPGAS